MRRCLPGLSASLAAMFAVIANRLKRGYSDLIRLRGYVHILISKILGKEICIYARYSKDYGIK